jgi:hypothetical protein
MTIVGGVGHWADRRRGGGGGGGEARGARVEEREEIRIATGSDDVLLR